MRRTEKHIVVHLGEIEITPFPNPIATKCSLAEILEMMENKSGDILVCSIEGSLDALQDGEYLSKVNASQDTIEHLFNIISEKA